MLQGIKHAVSIEHESFRDDHINVWQSYWRTGVRISDSKADGAINGHKINSTIYYILSHIPQGMPGVEKSLAMNEGCYRGHHTLYVILNFKKISSIVFTFYHFPLGMHHAYGKTHHLLML